MNKHVLLLTAATVALLAAPAHADTSITNKTTKQVTTSSSGNVTISSAGSVVVTTAGPAVEINSANTVENQGQISNINTTDAIGVQLDGTKSGNGPGQGTDALQNLKSILVNGSGNTKTGILVAAPDGAGDIFNGNINLEAGSTLNVKGDNSFGLNVASGATLNGDITIAGGILTNPSQISSTGGTATGMAVNGSINGNISIATGGSILAYGSAAEGLTILGPVSGSLANAGTLTAAGTSTPSSAGTNPQARSALIISNDIGGGIYNAGPSPSSASTATATMSVQGTGPAIYISPNALGSTTSTGLTIGTFSDTDDPNFSLLNRGNIASTSLNQNVSETNIWISGGLGAPVSFTGGIFNSGSISAASTTDGKNINSFNATALLIDDYVNLNTGNAAPAAIVNSNESGSGTISAAVSGLTGGVATAIRIGLNKGLTNVSSLINKGTIAASATTTDITTKNTLAAYGIVDLSGSLTSIDNSGVIAATATTLQNNNQITVAADLSASTKNINFVNSGTIIGEVKFGYGNDTLDVNGPAGGTAAIVNGDILFGGTTAGGDDTLNIGTVTNGSVIGAVTEVGAGRVNINIGGGGTGSLTLQNTASSLVVDKLQVNDGGALHVTLSNAFNQDASSTNPAVVTAHTIDFAQLAKLDIGFGSFVSTPQTGAAKFTVFDADGGITMAAPGSIKTYIQNTIPYLFIPTICGYNITGGFTNDSGCSVQTTATSKLVVTLKPKTASQLHLTGNVARIFPYANDALATDDQLGAAIVTNVTSDQTAQAAYSSFLPDLSGSSRAVAISITDQATGPVGARQRALRMYAAQPGGTTMWGQEFVERLTSGGDTEAYRASGFGFALGFDGGDPMNGRYGAALTFFSGDQTGKGPNFTKTNNQWYMLTGYTDWRGKGLFLDTQLTVGYANLDGKRSIQFTDASGNALFTRHADGKRAGLLFAGGASTGVVLTYGSTVFMPQISMDGLTMREEGYTESGGGAATGVGHTKDGFDLRVQPYYASSLRGYAGTTLREDLKWGDFYIQPEGRVGYRYDFLANAVTLKAAFASMANTSRNQFTLTGPSPERGNLILGGGLAVTTGAWSLGVNYDYLRGSGGSVSQTGTITLVGRI